MCCNDGNCGVSDEMFKQPEPRWCHVLSLVNRLPEVSRELNNLCNFSAIGTQCDHEEETQRGFRYRFHNGVPQVYHLHGRTYHRMFRRDTNAVAAALTDFYFSHTQAPSEYVSEADVEMIRHFMMTNNQLAHRLAYIYDVRNPDLEDAAEVRIHPDDFPLSRTEAFSLHGSANSPWSPPRLAAIAASLEHEDNEYASVFIPEYSDVWENAQYPLIHPTGEGGFFSLLAGRGYQRPLFVSSDGSRWTECESVAKYYKYLSYQYAPYLLSLRTLFQQFTLDQFSR